MKIAMFTNTYTPHVGGVAQSVSTVARELRRQGHEVIIVAPEFPGGESGDGNVVRVPAIQRFNGTDFSVALPVPMRLRERLVDFNPDIIHSHHPFLLGDTAVRAAAELERPIVFTHHTLYERYTHYVPADSVQLQRFVVELAIGYGNLCSRVVAPSASIAVLLKERGLVTPIEVIPTGVDPNACRGDGLAARERWGIPSDAFIVGHVGRLAPEKNLDFLGAAVSTFLRKRRDVYHLLVGSGPSSGALERRFREAGVFDRVRMTGALTGNALADAYTAMDVFAFASCSETQGLVLMEAIMSGVFTVALDAPGARDVIDEGGNGVLIAGENLGAFREALEGCWREWRRRDPGRRERVRRSGEPYAIARTTARLARLYAEVVASAAPPRELDLSGWSTLLRRLEAEWALWSNMAASAAESMKLNSRQFRRGAAEVVPLPLSDPAPDGSTPPPRDGVGLVMIQIDGLSRREFERALAHRRLPFLRRLLHRHGYTTASLYSGIPSTTPAVQGELFYGVPTCVPSFEFFDRRRGEIGRMFYAESAQRVESVLAGVGRPLLAGGSSYSNIFTGGARNACYCAASFELASVVRIDDPMQILLRAYWYLTSTLRIGALLLLEGVLALGDFLRGIVEGHSVKHEALFLPTRVAIGILLRELITIGARIDIERGAPIVHLNFLGYDEHAHRRGPASSFAHWSLKGIDRAIERIARTAERSTKRRYEVWVYADHGQEATVPYEKMMGRPLAAVVSEIFGEAVVTAPNFNSEAIELFRSGQGSRRPRLRMGPEGKRGIVLSAMGPFGHIYLERPLPPEVLAERCRELASHGGVPLVLARMSGELRVWNAGGSWLLESAGPAVWGDRHPFAREVAADLAALCRHVDAGDVVIAGWRPTEPPLSFVYELGAHGGPGARETHAFALLPARRLSGATAIRPIDLRGIAERALGEDPERSEASLTEPRSAAAQ